MSALRKLALIMLLLAIAPAMVLSGMPVKHCASSAGQHQAIEFVLDGVSHGGDHDSHHQEHTFAADTADHCDTADLAEPQSCVDTSLATIAQLQTGEFEFLALPAMAAPFHAAIEPDGAARVLVGVSQGDRLRTDPRMSAHRVTVLRI